MKKFYSYIVAAILMAGSLNAWADESTLTPTSSTIAPSDDHFTVTYANGGGSTTI